METIYYRSLRAQKDHDNLVPHYRSRKKHTAGTGKANDRADWHTKPDKDYWPGSEKKEESDESRKSKDDKKRGLALGSWEEGKKASCSSGREPRFLSGQENLNSNA